MKMPTSHFDPRGGRDDEIDFLGNVIPHRDYVGNWPQLVYEGIPFWLAKHLETGKWHPMPCAGKRKICAKHVPPPPIFDTLEEAWQWALLVHASTAETLKD